VTLSQQWQDYTAFNSGLSDNLVNTILITPDDLKWFGTEQGLSIYDGENWKVITSGDGLTDNRVNDLALLSAEMPYTVWVATDSGASRLDVHAFDDIRIMDSYFSQAEGLISNHVYAVGVDTGLANWFGTDKGASVLNNEVWTPLTEDDYLNSNLVTDIESDMTGLVHIATKGGGVARLRMEVDGITSASTINFWSSMPVDTVYTIYIDRNNVQWFGNRQGAFRHEGIDSKANWQVFRTTGGLIDNNVQCITEDSSGGIWFGTSSGVSCYDDDDFINYSEADGLVHNNVKDIAVDSDGDIWFATEGGVSRFSRPSSIDHEAVYPRSFSLTNYPNPFNNGTILQLQMTEPDYVELSVWSLSGKQVRTISRQFVNAGVHSLYWNANDDHGNKLPSGIYFALLSSSGETISRKLVLLK
jgi:ligand-binding sensor domain-containing protein